jgi:polyhydroxybutyrate depolymerase
VPAERRDWALTSGGQEWTIHARIPKNLSGAGLRPLVLLFHGAGSGGERMLDDNGWADKAAREGFIAVAPDGLAARPHRPPQFFLNPRLWNDGQLRPNALRVKIDDTAFVAALLDDLAGRLPIDPGRVFAAGHSNGAGLVFRLGNAMAGRWAGLAAVAGHCWISDPRPARPLPTLYIVGTEDPLIPVAGGEVTMPWGQKTNPPVRRSLEVWARGMGVEEVPRTIEKHPAATVEMYGRETDPGFIRAVYVTGQGHGWPGGRESILPERFMGPALKTFRATDAVWDFFRALRPA